MTNEKIVTIEHLERIAKWAEYWSGKIRSELEKERQHNREMAALRGYEDNYIEAHLSEREATDLADGLGKTAEALRLVVAQNKRTTELILEREAARENVVDKSDDEMSAR
jgi:hypothetical protein